jgi:hypothetical protein
VLQLPIEQEAELPDFTEAEKLDNCFTSFLDPHSGHASGLSLRVLAR